MSGFKTVIWNAILVVIGALLPYLAGVQWTDYVSPTIATLIVAAINVILRVMTDSPIFKKA